jgi:hypothetical protein
MTVTIKGAAPYLTGLDPANPNRAAKVVSFTFVNLASDAFGLTGNGTNPGGHQLIEVEVNTGTGYEIDNCIFHAPLASAAQGGIDVVSPLDGSDRWVPKHKGRRFYRDATLTYSGGGYEMLRRETVTGTTSGATGDILIKQSVTSGSFASEDAAGSVTLEKLRAPLSQVKW